MWLRACAFDIISPQHMKKTYKDGKEEIDLDKETYYIYIPTLFACVLDFYIPASCFVMR